ncbi:hypothetical protein [Mucilaginibacter glaciei]|uniref:Uncharacterized protein n=1 Tax=Mucilaginibacter glaciei TaxID=2772109 RepID=A0A926S7T9_9SPHI|nr:hypothetical protein [Mucilaginibacter glaciei]MBD1395036.1 hypothetical protein [Mucilaginibacter glaciei]
MGKSTAKYDQDDVALAAFNKVMASPCFLAIIENLRTHDDWTELSQLELMSPDINQWKKNMNNLTQANMVSTMNEDGKTFYLLNLAYFEQLTQQFNVLTQQISDATRISNL